jgi:hypothetical protein
LSIIPLKKKKYTVIKNHRIFLFLERDNTQCKEKDSNGLFITKKGDDQYVKDYYKNREATDDGFFDSMVIANLTNSTLMGTLLGGNPAGALIGDMMNNSEEIQNNSTTFDDGTQLPSVGAELGGAVGEQISHESNIGDNPFS